MAANPARLVKVSVRRDKQGLAVTEHYFVECTDRADTAATALEASGLRSYAEPATYFGAILQATGFDAEEVDSANPAFGFMVRVELTTPGGTGEETEDPLDKEPVIVLSTMRRRVPFYRDIDDFPVVNSAGDPFDPPAETEERIRVILVTDRYAPGEYTDADFVDMEDTVNSDVFLNYPAGTVLFRESSVQTMVENNISFLEATLEFWYSPTGWFKLILDQGYRKKLSDGSVVTITDKDGNPANSPVLLDGDGNVLPEGDTGVVRLFIEFDEADFSFFDIVPTGA